MKKSFIIIIAVFVIVSLGIIFLCYNRGDSKRWGTPIPIKFIRPTARVPVFQDTPAGPDHSVIISHLEKGAVKEVLVGHKFANKISMFKIQLPDGRTGWVKYNALIMAYGPEVKSILEIPPADSPSPTNLSEDVLREEINKTVNGDKNG